MAFDPDLAARIRTLLADEPLLGERRMFGGVAFLIGGHMAVVASNQGGLMLRVDPGAAAELVASTAARHAQMRGSTMRGWVRVAGEDLDADDELRPWVELGVRTARALPPKTASSARR
jgi:TfoX/Sxy family transcriptional regulator of competence genes